MTKQLSQASLARALGLSPPAISKLKKLGMPTTSVLAARAWREQHQSIARRKPEPTATLPNGGEIPDFNESRARHEAALAALRELELGAANGSLVSRESVERGAFLAARQLRDGLGAAAGQIGARVASLTSASECEDVAQQVHRRLLEDFGREIAKLLGPAPAAAPTAE